MYGEKTSDQWRGVEDGLFSARFNSLVGKVGLKVREGWAAWFDETNGILYAILCEPDSSLVYPHDGHHVEVWSTGDVEIPYTGPYMPMANLEIEVLGPLTTLKPGESTSLETQWGACRCSGVVRIVPCGVIVEEPSIDPELRITGTFGVFYTAALVEVILGGDKRELAAETIADVSPRQEVRLNKNLVLPAGADTVQYQLRDSGGNVLGILAELSVP